MSGIAQTLGFPPTSAVQTAQALGTSTQMPSVGAMQGQLSLNPKIAPKVTGNARPFAPGEFILNPDGSRSSEITVTVTNPNLNGGKPTVLPSLWLVDGKPTRVDEDQAVAFATQSGLNFPAQDSLDAAEQFATQRENIWETTPYQSWGNVPPLWQVGP